jgi:hypothetical protein
LKIDLKDTNSWIPRVVFESYCGENSDKLLSFYDKAVEKRKMTSMSLNWVAVLFLPAWLGYRRQWTTLATVTVIFSVLPFLEVLLSFPIPTSGVLGSLLVISLLANSTLLMNAQRDYLRLKQEGIDIDAIVNTLQNKASASILYAVLSSIGYLAVVFGMAMIADVVFGLPY